MQKICTNSDSDTAAFLRQRETFFSLGACSGVSFFNWGLFACNLVYRRSEAVLYVCCIRSGVTQTTFFMLLYLCRMCQCGLHAVLWSHIGILMRLLAAEHRSTAGLLFFSQCLCGTILLTLYSMVWDWRVLRAGPILFVGLSCSLPF